MMTPRVLVAYATRHGSTGEIAQAIGAVLRDDGLVVDVRRAGEVGDLGPYPAVIVGSALYLLRWHLDALEFLHAHDRALTSRDVWLFDSGPLDDSAATRPAVLPAPVQALADRIGIRGHVTFGGRFDPETAGVVEHLIAMSGAAGDFRDFDRIRAWARDASTQIAIARLPPVE
jgi:menaquinone-dependent protoporphyrinogen oxidase